MFRSPVFSTESLRVRFNALFYLCFSRTLPIQSNLLRLNFRQIFVFFPDKISKYKIIKVLLIDKVIIDVTYLLICFMLTAAAPYDLSLVAKIPPGIGTTNPQVGTYLTQFQR